MDDRNVRCANAMEMPGSEYSKQFGIAVRNRRIEVQLSQEALSELAQIHTTYVSMVERGLRNPTLEIAARLAGALDIPLSQLIERSEFENSSAKPVQS